MTRRAFLATPVILKAATTDPWGEADAIVARIKAPTFPNRDFEITRYGAAGDGQKDCSDAIAKAIGACATAGGGNVVIPKGAFLTGPIHLKSGVNLHVSGGATLLFSRDPKRYLPLVFTRWEGTECMNYSPFFYAFEQSNIAITGAGILDGQADGEHWWPWKGGSRKRDPSQAEARKALVEMGNKDVPVGDRIFGEGHYLRPQFIQPYRCTNVLIEGVTIRNSPMWEINPVLCRNVTVRDVKIDSHGPNNDGCDPESSKDVLIRNCLFDTGDDCIAIKSGRNRDGRRVGVACENLVIEGCEMKDGHGGVSIGSECSGDVRNVFVRNCRMDSRRLERALRIKTNSYRGGAIENVHMRDVTIGQVAEAVLQVDFSYEEGEGGPLRPIVRNVSLQDVTCKRSKYALDLKGYKTDPIQDIRISRCTFDNVAKPDVIEHVDGFQMDHVKVNGTEVIAGHRNQ